MAGLILPEDSRSGAVWLGINGTDFPAAFWDEDGESLLSDQQEKQTDVWAALKRVRNIKKLNLKNINCAIILWTKHSMAGT